MRRPILRACLQVTACLLTITTAATLGPAPTASAARPAGATRASDPPASSPLFGGTVYENPGESYRDAYQRVIATYGGSIDVVRMFFRRLPQPWSKITANIGTTPVVVSFKADPAAVVAGQYDAELSRWFADAPTDRRTFWSYWHEPENNAISPALYRRAWQHLADLAAQADNPKLRATMILMCWSLDRKSGRDWHDYYAGDNVIDVMAFDCYNVGRKKGVYRDPDKILEPVVAAAGSVGKPWGIAEFGSTVVNTDGGEQGRADWLRAFARYVRANGGTFATYFDSFVGFDYRLHDAISRNAWRDIVQAD
jgi:hypothetical protein